MLFDSFLGMGAAALLAAGAAGLGLIAVPRGIAPPSLRALSGFPLFILIATLLALVPYLLWSVTVAAWVVVGAAVLCIVDVVMRKSYTDIIRRREAGILAALIVVSVIVIGFGWNEMPDGAIRSVPGAYGDGVLHALNARYVANGPDESVAMPAFASEEMREPFGYTLFTGILLRLGFSLGGAFVLPASFVLAALIGWSGLLATRLVRLREPSAWVRPTAFVVAGFLAVFGGGLQWIIMVFRDGLWMPADFFGVHDPWDKIIPEGLVWANHINIFASQKHTLLALAFVVVLAGILLHAVRHQTEHLFRITLGIFAAASGAVVFFQAHAFLGIAMLWAVALWLTKTRTMFVFATAVAAIALPFFVWYMRAVGREGFLAPAFGYLATEGPYPWIVFWVVNLGAFVFLAIWALIQRQYGATARFLFGIPAVLLFVLGNVMQFQPYLWDNIKLFQVAWFLLLPLVVAELVIFASQAGLWRKIVAVLIVLTMALTSLSELTAYAHFRSDNPVFTVSDRQRAAVLDDALPRDAIVLAATDQWHNHPVTLTGRRLVSGYGGWIWTRGLPWAERQAEMRAVIAASDRTMFCAAVALTHATHIIVTDIERAVWGVIASPYVRGILLMDEEGMIMLPVADECG